MQPDGRNASSTDPATWCIAEMAELAVCQGHFGGVGFVLGPRGDGFSTFGLDFDGCFRKHSLLPWMRPFVDLLDGKTWLEKSPSGYGLKMIGLVRDGDVPLLRKAFRIADDKTGRPVKPFKETINGKQRSAGVEIYAEQVRLAYSLRSIRSDASAQRKFAQQQREAEMDAAVRHFFERANIPPAMLARMQAAASSGALFGAKARAPSGAAAAGGDPTPPTVDVPTGSEARAPSSAATPGGEPAPPSEARAQPESEAQAPPDGGGNAQPGEAPRRPFRITLPA
jgi:hypothetical protein